MIPYTLEKGKHTGKFGGKRGNLDYSQMNDCPHSKHGKLYIFGKGKTSPFQKYNSFPWVL